MNIWKWKGACFVSVYPFNLVFLFFHHSLDRGSLTYLDQMEFPTLISCINSFLFEGLFGDIFILIKMLIYHSVSKHRRP